MEEYKQTETKSSDEQFVESHVPESKEETPTIQETLRKLGVEFFSDTSIEPVVRIISERFGVADSSALERLKRGEEFEGSDFGSIVSDLYIADFSIGDIEEVLVAHQEGRLEQLLLDKIEQEKEYLARKLNNPEFIQGVKRSIESVKEFVDSIGLTSLIEERWPKVMYTGKFGRMLLRSKEMGFFAAHALAAGEYVHEDKTARLHLVSDMDIPAGKKVLETQIHEMLHGISKNEIHEEDVTRINQSGIGILRFNPESLSNSRNTFNNINEGITEYFARKFCDDAYSGEIREEHAYDFFAQNIGLIIQQISSRTAESVEDVEKKFFEAYIKGESEIVSSKIEGVLGKFGMSILNGMSKKVAEFLHAQVLASLGVESKDRITVDIDAIEAEGLDKDEFVAEYPFVRVIKYDFDPQTFEPIEVEV